MSATPTSVTFIGVAVSPRARKLAADDPVDEQRGHADRIGGEHGRGLMRRAGLEGAVLEGDADDEVGDQKKDDDEGRAERDRQRSGAVLRVERRLRASPRATSVDISLSSTEPVAMTMTPPGN